MGSLRLDRGVYLPRMRTPVTERLGPGCASGALYRLLEHAPVFTSAEAARVRGTPPGPAPRPSSPRPAAPVQVVLPHPAVDNALVRAILGTRTLRFATPEELLALTGCVPARAALRQSSAPVLADAACRTRGDRLQRREQRRVHRDGRADFLASPRPLERLARTEHWVVSSRWTSRTRRAGTSAGLRGWLAALCRAISAWTITDSGGARPPHLRAPVACSALQGGWWASPGPRSTAGAARP